MVKTTKQHYLSRLNLLQTVFENTYFSFFSDVKTMTLRWDIFPDSDTTAKVIGEYKKSRA